MSDAADFVGVLKERKAAYDLFGYLEAKFNGDIFPVSEEEKRYIDDTHLGWLSSFLQGEERLSTGQLGLWKFYSFDVIPIEFISNIYEEFFHIQQTAQGDNADDNGTHYTPHHLVEFLVDEVFPWESTNTECRVLDPACGSGIFLVEVYRRLIERWHQANPDKLIDFTALERLLTRNIFGVDCNEEAVRVAAFSLYLTLCDYLEPRHIWDKVRFPSLKGKNLFAEDFFRHGGNDVRYALVIGNPPWQSELTPDAEVYRKDIEQRHPDRQIAPDNQIALAFLWRSAEFCEPDGEVCLLMPSKGLLFNRSGPHQTFRRAFFGTYHVKTVVNFSALRHSLFPKGAGPGAAVFFAPRLPDDTTPILYCCPKPTHSVEDKWQFIIDPYDIAQLPRMDARDSDVIWKVAMWGGARDYELIKRLMSEPFTRLGVVCDSRNWIHGEGLIVGNKTNDASIYYGKPFVPVKAVQRFALDEDALERFTRPKVERLRVKTREIFSGPHMLIKQSPVAGERTLRAVLLKGDALFTHSVVGIHAPPSDIEQLAKCCLVLNSRVPLYYAMMTSRRWLVERDELEKDEIMDLPIPPLGVGDVAYEYLRKLATAANWEEELRLSIEQMYDLSEEEEILIEDAIDYTLEYFRLKMRSNASKSAMHSKGDIDILSRYLETMIATLRNSFSREFEAVIFQGDAPLSVIALRPSNKEHVPGRISLEKSQQKLDDTLRDIDGLLRSQRSTGVFIQRIARVYIGDSIYIVKPDQRRYWTRSLALRDADEIYVDVMNARGVALESA